MSYFVWFRFGFKPLADNQEKISLRAALIKKKFSTKEDKLVFINIHELIAIPLTTRQ